MMLDRLSVELRTSIQSALVVLANEATAQGRGDIAAECTVAAASLPNTKVPYRLLARDLLCAAVDDARSRGSADEVRALENLVRALQDGGGRQIVGTLNYRPGSTPGEIMGAAEQAGKALIKGMGG